MQMATIRKHSVSKDGGPKRPIREVEPADYSDELSEDDFAAIVECASKKMDAEEWELVDGPAW